MLSLCLVGLPYYLVSNASAACSKAVASSFNLLLRARRLSVQEAVLLNGAIAKRPNKAYRGALKVIPLFVVGLICT